VKPDLSRSVRILGISVHDVTEDEAVEALRGFIEAGGPHRIVTPNPEFVMQARRDRGFREILNSSDLAIPDGVGLLAAARMMGTPLRAHVRGTDLVLRLAAMSPSQGWRWFLLGAGPGVAQDAAEALRRQFPGIAVVGAMPGSPDPAHDAETRRAILEVAPVHVMLVAYGAPRQERWIARNQEAIGVPVQMGIGGVLNFLAGRSPRAPEALRRLELEWAYRLYTEPWRWRRQLALPAFAALAAREAAARWLRGRE
jgi:N-acetylglucosaminyldiphosphoundecaprenol N-acetyl-beta-D-mannosaminyltransferase